jgi:hypothetical protein
MIDRHEVIGLVVFLALLFATFAPVIERAHAAFAYFDIMERGFR